MTRQFETTLSAFRRLVRGAREEILLVSAFVHPSAVEAVGSELADATRRGVKVLFITQEPDGGHDPEAVRSALSLVLAGRGNPSMLEFRTANLGARNCMHAKILVVDRQHVLIGSANFTGAALAENVEAGLSVRGPVAEEFARLIRALGRQ